MIERRHDFEGHVLFDVVPFHLPSLLVFFESRLDYRPLDLGRHQLTWEGGLSLG